MHTLVSFFGCIDVLMKGSGLQKILSVAYKGISYMLNGKAWSKALSGYGIVVQSLLKDCVLSGNVTHETIEEVLASARLSKTSRLWVDCFIYRVVIAHMFVIAERGGNYILRMHCMTKMLPYVFAQVTGTMPDISHTMWQSSSLRSMTNCWKHSRWIIMCAYTMTDVGMVSSLHSLHLTWQSQGMVGWDDVVF